MPIRQDELTKVQTSCATATGFQPGLLMRTSAWIPKGTYSSSSQDERFGDCKRISFSASSSRAVCDQRAQTIGLVDGEEAEMSSSCEPRGSADVNSVPTAMLTKVQEGAVQYVYHLTIEGGCVNDGHHTILNRPLFHLNFRGKAGCACLCFRRGKLTARNMRSLVGHEKTAGSARTQKRGWGVEGGRTMWKGRTGRKPTLGALARNSGYV